MGRAISNRKNTSITFAIAAAATGVFGAPAFAQYPPPGSVAPPGSITIMRDVPQRPAFAVGQPGTVTTVEVVPLDIIFAATSQTVIPLTDEQNAAVASGVQQGVNGMQAGMAGADAALDTVRGSLGLQSNQLSSNTLGGEVSGALMGAVDAGTSAINAGMSSLSSALSGLRDD